MSYVFCGTYKNFIDQIQSISFHKHHSMIEWDDSEQFVYWAFTMLGASTHP